MAKCKVCSHQDCECDLNREQEIYDSQLTDMQEMLAITAVEFATENKQTYIEFLRKNHPYLHQVYCQIQGEG